MSGLRAELEHSRIYLWRNHLLGIAEGSLKSGWRARPAGGRMGRIRYGTPALALAMRLSLPLDDVKAAIHNALAAPDIGALYAAGSDAKPSPDRNRHGPGGAGGAADYPAEYGE